MATPAPPPASGGGTNTAEVANTKAGAIPALMIFAILLAIFFTRHSLTSAFAAAKDDFRKMILFGGGMICTLLSIFLLPTSAFNYGAASVLFAYMSTLLCTPGLLEAKADSFFLIYVSWFLTLLGMPDGWSDGLLKAIDACDTWFNPNADTMCKDGWVTYVTILAIAIIIINFFCVIALMSLVFNASDSAYAYEEVEGNRMNSGDAPSGSADYQTPPE